MGATGRILEAHGLVTLVTGDLFSSPLQTLVNPVNTVGVMGRGLALEFKSRYPAMDKAYRAECASGRLVIGKLFLFVTDKRWILNFPTKRHFRDPSRLAFVEAGLRAFPEFVTTHGITSAAFPALGCGLGNLPWTRVYPMMLELLSIANIPIEIYAPSDL